MLPLKLRAVAILLRLATVAASTLLLVARHACSQRNINSRRGCEAEALCDLDQIQLVNVEDAPQAV